MNRIKKSFAEKWGSFVVKNIWTLLLFSIILAFSLASQGKVEFDGDYHVFFSKSNPELEAFDALQEKYSKVDNIIMVLAPKNKNVFTKENLIAIEELTAQAWNTHYSSRVDALTNYQHTRAEGDDLYVEDLSYESENLKKISFDSSFANASLLIDLKYLRLKIFFKRYLRIIS